MVLHLSGFPWGADPGAWVRSVALAADEIGLHGIALMDHLIQIPQVGRAWDPIPEPLVTLGLLAGLHTRLALGTLVSPVTFWWPGLLAKAVATLDAPAGRRAFCGVGTGWWERKHAAYGLEFPTPGERLDLLEEGIETMRALWPPAPNRMLDNGFRSPRRPPTPGWSTTSRSSWAVRAHDPCGSPDPWATAATCRPTIGCPPASRWSGRPRETPAATATRSRSRSWTWPSSASTATDTAARVERYRRLAELGVGTVFLALPDLSGADDLERIAPLLAARCPAHLSDAQRPRQRSLEVALTRTSCSTTRNVRVNAR